MAAAIVCVSGEAMLPSFDHGAGDPVPDAVKVIPQNKIVLVEGNYLLLGAYNKPAGMRVSLSCSTNGDVS